MKMKSLYFGLLLCFNLFGYAQSNTKEVLFTIDNNAYYTDEFLRVYHKNLDLVKEESQKDLNHYLELFIGYKLKINKAYKLGLQHGTPYQAELKSYRSQLSKNYTTDSKVTQELVEEAYNRYLKEIKASHILIALEENATPADTLKAFRQVQEIRQKALKGADFGDLAVQYSQDPSAKDNKGNLGYFSAFKMLYAFESEAYKTSKGSISNPVRTRYGYHLIKVEDIRDNRGEISVAHIMILNPTTTGDTPSDIDKPKNTIQDIYKKLQQGEKFEDLAKQFSEDKSSSSKGGVINRFGSGQLSSEEFESVAFALTTEKPISEPFQSQFGWHIVKLIGKFPLKKFPEMQTELEKKVSKDDRSRLIFASMTDKLRKKYPVKRDNKTYTALVKLISNDIYEGKWDVPTNSKVLANKWLTINDRPIDGTAFLTYVKEQQQNGIALKPISKLTDHLYQKFVDEQLNSYFKDNLEKEFPEFSAVMDEYRDGLLLFDLMEKEIWTKSKSDTLGLKKFYETNLKNYNWKDRVDVVIASSTKMDVIKKAKKALGKGKTTDYIKEQLNVKDGVVNVMTNSGVFEEGNDVLPKGLQFKAGVSDIIKEGDYYYVVKVNQVIPSVAKTLEECKGKAINDYQLYLEENWVKDLKTEFKLEVNQSTFDKVKKEMKS